MGDTKARAVLIGIGYDIYPAKYQLGENPRNDVKAMSKMLAKHMGIPVAAQAIMTDSTPDKPTRPNIKLACTCLVRNARKGHRGWWHFSGHCEEIEHQGQQRPRPEMDNALITYELDRVTDEDLREDLVAPLDDTPARLMMTVDACQSGTAVDAPVNMRIDRRTGEFALVGGERNPKPVLDCCVVLISACADWQTAKNGGRNDHLGAWTDAFTSIVERGGPEQTIKKIARDVQRYLDTEGIRQDIQISAMRASDLDRPLSDFGVKRFDGSS